MKKQEIYVNIQGKTKEELTDLWEFLDNVGEKQYDDKENFINDNYYNILSLDEDNEWSLCLETSIILEDKQEVTIEQLKEIIKPMGTKFTPIAMKCTQEQFEAIKPKLQDKEIYSVTSFDSFPYLINTDSSKQRISNIDKSYISNRLYTIHETWNEEVFLRACGIEVDSLEQQLQKAEAEVKRLQSLIEEENKPKVGDWAMLWEEDEKTPVFGLITDVTDYFLTCNGSWEYANKITNPELIKLLENECSTKN